MAIGGLLKGLRGTQEASVPTPLPAAGSPEQRLALLDQMERGSGPWLWEADREGRITYISDNLAEMLDVPGAEILGTPATEIFLTDSGDEGGEGAGRRNLKLLMRAQKPIRDLAIKAGKTDRDAWFAIHAAPVGSGEDFAGYRGWGVDITDDRKKEVEDSRMAAFDSLTGLANRFRMEQRIDQTLVAFQQAKRTVAILMLDLDRFKMVNDTLGHAAGDDLLKQVAERIKRVVDNTAEIGRLGGDEFQIMIPDIDDRGKLGEISGKVIAMLSQPFVLDGARAHIGGSVGIAIAPYDGITREEIVHSADLALYAAKHGGRGQYRFYSADLKNSARDRKGIEADLAEALQNGEFELNYQPIASRKDNSIVALEALLRWYHPERGTVAPDLFIPIAEDSNLIVGIGEWVLREACAEAASWPGKVRVNVNVSGVQLLNESFAAKLTNILAETGLEPQRLELELNEQVFLRDTQLVEEAIQRLRKIGVRLALDDFGAGMSSLGYLKSAHFDTLKIDPEFLRDACAEGNRNGDLIRAIVALAGALGMESVAEAVEAMDELELVNRCGVSHIQGFIYAPPMDVEEMRELVGGDSWTIEPDGPKQQRAERRRVFRKINLIHEDHFYEVMLRDLSRSGAMIEGLADVPVGEKFVLDFGEGQLAVANVVRSEDDKQGLVFEIPLVPDGAGGLVTRHRVSPYALAAAGMPLQMLPPGNYPLVGGEVGGQPKSMPKFAQLSDAARKARD